MSHTAPPTGAPTSRLRSGCRRPRALTACVGLVALLCWLLPAAAAAQQPGAGAARDAGDGSSAGTGRIGDGSIEDGGGQSVLVQRALFDPPAQRPIQDLAEGPPQKLSVERWRVPAVTRLRITSLDEGTFAVLHFRPAAEASNASTASDRALSADGGTELAPASDTALSDTPDDTNGGTAARPPHADLTSAEGDARALQLNVILVGEEQLREYLYRAQSQRLRAGRMRTYKRYWLAAGLETELAGDGLRVTKIVVQDDGESEVRLSREGDTLLVDAVTPYYGGDPDKDVRPWYQGLDLRMSDSTLLLGGYTDNAFADVYLWDIATFRTSYFFGTGTALLTRAMVSQQVWRNEVLALWFEGGAAYYQLTPSGGASTSTFTWSGAATLNWRDADWGAQLHMGRVDGGTAWMLFGSWQFLDAWSAVLNAQTFDDYTGYGLGVGYTY